MKCSNHDSEHDLRTTSTLAVDPAMASSAADTIATMIEIIVVAYELLDSSA